MAKTKRHLYVVEQRGDFIVVTANGAIAYTMSVSFTTKRDMASFIGRLLKKYYYEFGQLSELYTRKKDGTLSRPSSFGKDPRRTKG